jgi:hypothetical protein
MTENILRIIRGYTFEPNEVKDILKYLLIRTDPKKISFDTSNQIIKYISKIIDEKD